jgi:hypothetical protein
MQKYKLTTPIKIVYVEIIPDLMPDLRDVKSNKIKEM